MKAQDLMIGDFVFLENYGNAIIENIDNDFGDNPSVKLISENIKHKDGYKYGYCWCDLNEIFPLPLTPEILEKNEFECYSRESNLIWGITLPEGHFVLAYMDYYWEFTVDATIYRRIKIQYVHQLQHLLKLCKIEKEIIL